MGQTEQLLLALHSRFGDARGDKGPGHQDHPFSSVRLRRTLHLHVAHSRRTSDLPSLQLHQDGAVRWRQTESTSGHPGRRAHQQLSRDRSQGQTHRTATASATAARPSGADPEGAELPTVSRGEVPDDQREHKPASPVVVHRSNADPAHHRSLANETSQELLRGQETGLDFGFITET